MATSPHGSSIPMDVWEEIFQAMQELGYVEGLKQCSSMNHVFRAMLSPRIFASARINCPVDREDIQLYFMPIAHLVKHLSIQGVTGPNQCIAKVENALSGPLIDIFSLSMTYDKFPNLDDLSMLLNHFPNLKKLALNIISEGEEPELAINHTRINESSIPIHTERVSHQLEQLEVNVNHYYILLSLVRLLCPIPGAGEHLTRLNLKLQDTDDVAQVLVPWLDNPGSRLTELKVRFDYGYGFWESRTPGIISTTITSLNLSSKTHSGNSPIISVLNLSLLPAVRTIFIRFNVDEHGRFSFISGGQHEMSAFSGDASMQDYNVSLRKRMSVLEHVEVVFAIENKRLSDEQKLGYVKSTMFNRACWQRGLLKAFLMLRQDPGNPQTSDWREEIDMGPYV